MVPPHQLQDWSVNTAIRISAAFRHFFLAMYNRSEWLPQEFIERTDVRRRLSHKTMPRKSEDDDCDKTDGASASDLDEVPDDQASEVKVFKTTGGSEILHVVKNSLLDISESQLCGDTSFLMDFHSNDGSLAERHYIGIYNSIFWGIWIILDLFWGIAGYSGWAWCYGTPWFGKGLG